MQQRREGLLVLADGTEYRGLAFGAEGERAGEVVFNTAMAGYQEVATDPSYAGQIVCMTSPHIGNYGVNAHDMEAERPYIEGMIVRSASRRPSNFRSEEALPSWFQRAGIVGLEEVDTRRLTRHIRTQGAVNGILSTSPDRAADLAARAREMPSMTGRDLVSSVTCPKAYVWEEGWAQDFAAGDRTFTSPGGTSPGGTSSGGTSSGGHYEPIYDIVAVDYGIKRNILRTLVTFGLRPTVVPASESAAEILARRPRGVFLSNGPGDPAAVTYAIETIRALLGRVPVFGICLGHQLLALAAGGRTEKLKFGHRGVNHPVREHETGRIEITSQNHGFVVDAESLAATSFRPTHTNLNDMTNAGIASGDLRAFAVQYHPEAAPGPHDAQHLFLRFRRLLAPSVDGVPSR